MPSRARRLPYHWTDALVRLVVMLALVLLVMTSIHEARAGEIPDTAPRYRHELVRIAQQEMGLNAPVALLAAQIHQESTWRPEARSAYASGLAQFTPGTGADLARKYPELAPPSPTSPGWALRALVRFDRDLLESAHGHTACDRWWFALRGYNGGPGHVRTEARLAPDPLDRASVDAQCGKARRAALHCAENLGYPQRILQRLQPLYLKAGWGGEAICR